MSWYKIKPEVPASIGPNSILERTSGAPLKVIKLHLIFEGWLGGDLMETSPVFYVTESLKNGLQSSSLSGIDAFEKIEITRSSNFLELYPDKELPDFFLLRINGIPYTDDFGLDKGYLVLSSKAKDFLMKYNLSDAELIDAG